MPANAITIRSSDGARFDCYLAVPQREPPVPAIVLASTVRGVDHDLRTIADAFAHHGYIAAAPDLFWRATGDSPSRMEQIRLGERDMADTLAGLNAMDTFNGRAAAMGFCYGGPYAILGPKRLGYEAGIACHGTHMLEYVDDIRDVAKPVCVMWGDRDYLAPPAVLDAYRDIPARMENVEVHVFPGVLHGYMMRGNTKAFDPPAHEFSMERTLAILERLR